MVEGVVRTILCFVYGTLGCVVPGKDHLIGFFAMGAGLLIVYVISSLIRGESGIGGGDVKFMAAIGLYLGINKVIAAFICGCLAAVIVETVKKIIQKLILHNTVKEKEFALVPYLVSGTFAVMVGEFIIYNKFNIC